MFRSYNRQVVSQSDKVDSHKQKPPQVHLSELSVIL